MAARLLALAGRVMGDGSPGPGFTCPGPGIWLPGSWLWLSGSWDMAARGRGDVSHVLALAAQGYRHEKAVLREW